MFLAASSQSFFCSSAPSLSPSASSVPSALPSLSPSDVPSLSPSDVPSLAPSETAGPALVFSREYENGVTYGVTSQYDIDWNTFLASLESIPVDSITISGSLDTTGRTCTEPTLATQIATNLVNLRNGSTVSQYVICDGLTWSVGICGGGIELTVGSGQTICGCTTDFYTVRPGFVNQNWGGIGVVCAASTHIMTVTVIPA